MIAHVSLLLLSVGAQSPPPPIRALAQAREVIAVIDNGDSAAAAKFIAARVARPEPGLVNLLLDLRRQSGGVDERDAEPLGNGVAVKLWARNADRGVMLFVAPDRVDSTRIGRLDALRFFHPLAEVRALPRASGGLPQFLRALRAELQRLADAGELSGTIAVARADSIVYQESFGTETRPGGAKNSSATLYHLASVGKMFTAVAIGQLIEAGRLSFEDSIGKLLPQFPWHRASRPITIRQLLSHSSGLGQSERAGAPIDSAFAATPPAFAPGSRFLYSNDGYEILGLIIERVSGESYLEYVKRHVYQPSGMRHTDAYLAEKPLAHRAIGYGHREDDYFGSQELVPNTDKVHGRGSAAGGSYGTAEDLIRFARAFTAGKLVGAAMRDTLTAPRWPLPGPFPEQYGYGFASHGVNGARVVGHAGGGRGWGICSRLDALADGSYSVAVLTNLDPPECEEVSRAIVEAVSR
jgi:CubicO group peptidase (beta-lactamase class C family)